MLAAFAVRWTLAAVMEDRGPFLLFIVSTLMVSWHGGKVAGLAAMVAGGLLGIYFFVPPYHTFRIQQAGAWVNLAGFLVVASGGIWIIEALRRAVRRATEATALAEERGGQLRANLQEMRLAQARLRELAEVVESAHDAVMTMSVDFEVRSCNKAAEVLLGRASSEMLGRSFLQFFPETCHERFRNTLDRLRRREAVEAIECVLLSHSERALELSVSISSLRNPAGELSGLSAIVRDLAPVRSAERALQASELRFQTMADAAPLMLWILGPDKRCTWTNKTALTFLGLTLEQVLASAWLESIHAEDRALCEGQFNVAFDAREPVELEYRLRRADGEYRWVFDRRVPYKSPAGVFQGYVGSCVDVTERKQAEEAIQQKFEELRAAQRVLEEQNAELAASRRALEAERSRYRELFDSAPVGYIISNRQGLIQQANAAAARLLNENAEFLAGFPLARLLAKEDRVTFFAHIGRLTRQEVEKIENWEVTLQPHLRVPFPCAITVNLLRDEAGAISGLRWLLRDVSERKQAEQRILRLNAELEQRVRDRTAELEKANRELEAFSYSVSHDLRAPLRSITGFSKAVLEEYGDKLDAQAVTWLEFAYNGGKRMSQLIEDLLAFSRYTRCEMRREEVDLSSLAHSIVNELRCTEPERQVEVHIVPELRATGDPALLRIALQNMLSNAWKFTGKRDHPRIEFGMEQRNGSNVFFVRDNGAGFEMSNAKRLFGVFQRLHSADEFPGTGIGLATVRRILHRHGGDVWAESEKEKGATFFFTLTNGAK